MKKIVLSIIVLCMSLGMYSCTKSINEQGKATWKLDPLRTKQVEDAVEGGASLLSVVYPPATAAVLSILTALGIWKTKIKPNYEKAKTEANLFHTSTHTLVAVIEEIKLKQPELWAKLKPFLEDSKMSTNVENVILALRNLPAKE